MKLKVIPQKIVLEFSPLEFCLFKQALAFAMRSPLAKPGQLQSFEDLYKAVKNPEYQK